MLGVFESLELGILDQFFRVQSSAKREVDDRILVVTIGEEDIAQMNQWPISDERLADLLQKLQEYGPASIGLDLFRNLPVAPGTESLIEIFETTPSVIGIERVVAPAVEPHQTLAALNQTASADVVVDDDGKLRRALLSLIAPNGDVKQGLAARLTLDYLYQQGIEPEMLDDRGLLLRLGKGRIERFEMNDGGYVQADDGGFQVLMNYRGDHTQFESVSITAVLAGELTDAMVRDRIVLVGSTAISINDLFYTPLTGDQQVAGVYIHAYVIKQLLDTVKGQIFLRTVPGYAEWLWTLFWVTVSHSVLDRKALKSKALAWRLVTQLLVVGSGLGITGYILFSAGWWLPLALPMVAVVSTVALGVVDRSQQLQNLAAFDELTMVANRDYFDQYLAEAMKQHKQLSLILCSVDYFQEFNNLYGYSAGDRCLQQVARAINLAVHDSDLVARYGEEKFAIVLPDTTAEMSADIAKKIQRQVRQLEILHDGSKESEWIALSYGMATISSQASISPHRLVSYAGQALDKAKQTGQSSIVLSDWQELVNTRK
ncbi:MAG: GGDEF domain [Phormidesmis priestleyi Ana]|uniref:GGDEF domain n=1 Tax=Phormidesmis priestleyi Ana TaxID=1666911 RepID=A0A0P7ZIZ1_9CYAN|nr:MAG: GGDEF domain [Phormidesmis priestleyi Ana]